jgi:hypothetical protein
MATSPPSSQRHHQHHHRLSPSFTDSAIDVELSESGRTEQSEQSHVDDELETRLARIAQLAAAQDSFRGLDGDGRAAVERYLDGLEGQLLDPRPQITREIAKNRPVSRSASNSSTTAEAGTGTVTPTAITQTTTTRRRKDENRAMEQTSHDLTALLEELSAVNAELQQRRVEACHIYDLFTSKCEGMAQRIIELDHETHEL